MGRILFMQVMVDPCNSILEGPKLIFNAGTRALIFVQDTKARESTTLVTNAFSIVSHDLIDSSYWNSLWVILLFVTVPELCMVDAMATKAP